MCFLPFLNFIEFVLVLPAPPAEDFIFCAGVWGKSFFTNDCHSVRQLAGAARHRTPRFTISHLNALRAAVRIEAYGLYAQK